ncbi:hypothetical protein NG844_02305 [Enterococcus faecalis]|uniref:hypothetical protein n=1 Tax=Enterococcus faecalis TaxID=1351 RepID=UPI002091D9FC|nr:hypothetical protein [Enterococcus faecalis]MCO5446246.1 hypothetical protein [Enterococcus faecalis]
MKRNLLQKSIVYKSSSKFECLFLYSRSERSKKVRRARIKNSKLLATLLLLFQTVNTGITPLITYAEERYYPEEVTIGYDANNIYNVSVVYNNGKVFNTHKAPTDANYKGKKQPVFCIGTEVNIINPINLYYEKNPLPDMPDRVKLVSILWEKGIQDL